LLARDPARIIARMFIERFARVCREEFQKARCAIVAVYEEMRAADERALHALRMFVSFFFPDR